MQSISRLVATWILPVALAGAIASPASAAPDPRESAPECGASIDKPNGEAWRCAFADEFDGATLDESKWRPLTTAASDSPGTSDCWMDSSENIAVSGGFLRLTSRREDKPFTCAKADGTTYDAEVSSGSVSSYGSFAQAYGRWDVRARFPKVTLPGSHGSLWLMPQEATYGEWPASGEIHLADFSSLYPDRVVPYIHYNLSSPDRTVTDTTCMVPDPWNFHTYSMVWTPERIVITIDGAACVDHEIHAAEPLSGSQPFDQPFVLNLTQTMGLGTNAPLEGTPLPLTTEVDYVRVWS